MDNLPIRYQYNPTLTDTVGFFDYCIPLINTADYPIADSMQKYYITEIHDFVKPALPAIAKKEVVSVFTPHKLHFKTIVSKPIQKSSSDWIIGFLLISLILFAWIQTNYNKRLRQIIKAVVQPYFVNQLEREGNLFSERISLGLGIIFYVITAIFISLATKSYGYSSPGISELLLILLICGILVGLDVLKGALIFITGFIFRTQELSHEINLNSLIFNHLIGIVLFPIAIFALFWKAQIILLVGLIIFSLLMIYRFFRIITIGISSSKYNLFYLFLYLCTLEILPLLLLLRTTNVL